MLLLMQFKCAPNTYTFMVYVHRISQWGVFVLVNKEDVYNVPKPCNGFEISDSTGTMYNKVSKCIAFVFVIFMLKHTITPALFSEDF